MESNTPQNLPGLLHSDRAYSELEQKKFFIDLKENDRGRFVQITEKKAGHRAFVIIPMDALDGIAAAIGNIRNSSAT